MTPADRAFEILYSWNGHEYSRELYRALLKDSGANGKLIRGIYDAIERGIIADRAAIAKASGPS